MKKRGSWLGWLGGIAALCCALPAQAVPIDVKDPSFEWSDREPSEDPLFSPRRWSPVGGAARAGRQEIDPPLPGQEGPYVGYLDMGPDGGVAAWFQDITIIEEGTYTTTVDLASLAGREPVNQPFKINYEAVGFGLPKILLSSTEVLPSQVNSTEFMDFTAEAVLPAGHPAIGGYLRLVFVIDGGAESGSDPLNPGGRYLIDNVRLDLAPPSGPTESIFVGESSFQPEGWYRTYTDGNNAGSFHPVTPLFPNQVGDQLGFATMSANGGHAGLYQDGPVIQPGTYTLTAAVGVDPENTPTSSHLVLKFEASNPGNAFLGGDIFLGNTLSTTSLNDLSTTITIEEGSEFIGRTLRSVLVAENADDNATYYFDNVRIDFTPLGGSLAGDFDGDGTVDADDLAQWKSDFGVDGGSDADGDGDSDGADFLIWQQNVGATSGSVGAVPEPATAVLAIAASALVLSAQRSRGRVAPIR